MLGNGMAGFFSAVQMNQYDSVGLVFGGHRLSENISRRTDYR